MACENSPNTQHRGRLPCTSEKPTHRDPRSAGSSGSWAGGGRGPASWSLLAPQLRAKVALTQRGRGLRTAQPRGQEKDCGQRPLLSLSWNSALGSPGRGGQSPNLSNKVPGGRWQGECTAWARPGWSPQGSRSKPGARHFGPEAVLWPGRPTRWLSSPRLPAPPSRQSRAVGLRLSTSLGDWTSDPVSLWPGRAPRAALDPGPPRRSDRGQPVGPQVGGAVIPAAPDEHAVGSLVERARRPGPGGVRVSRLGPPGDVRLGCRAGGGAPAGPSGDRWLGPRAVAPWEPGRLVLSETSKHVFFFFLKRKG